LWISQEGELHRGLEGADIIKFTFTPVPVKSEEDDEENPQSLHQSQPEENRDEHLKSEADGEDRGGPEPARNLNPDHLQPGADDEKSHSSEPETDDSCDWEDVKEPEWGLNSLQNNEVSVSDVGCNTGRKPVSSSECATSSGHTEGRLRPLTCSVCGKKCRSKNTLISHMKVHLKGHSSICSVCNKSFRCRAILMAHVRIHTGEKPYSCIFCGRRFAQKSHLKRHSQVHAKEKPFSCSLCNKRFTMRSSVKRHMKIHAKERPPRRL
ncbi:gastrula zinc finger protein XlCGF8.2DB-like, partial [Morone saxatilis]|uniref:gastrula zinc finger protein XlCGF8.2DB-like n=1 Tax=Morone saxatilis TaxID=34816 RepID=UPI0015E1C2BC